MNDKQIQNMAETFNIDKFKNNIRINVNKLWDIASNAETSSVSHTGNDVRTSPDDTGGKLTSLDDNRAVFTSRAPPAERIRALQEGKEEVIFNREPPANPSPAENGFLIKDGEDEDEQIDETKATSRGNTMELGNQYNKDTDLLFREPSQNHPVLKYAFIDKCTKLPKWTKYVLVGLLAVGFVALYTMIVFLIIKALGD